MKSLNLVLFITVFSLTAGNLLAQSKSKALAKKNPTKVENFSEGRILTESDLVFLNAVTADKASKNRGAASTELTIDNTSHKVGQTLTTSDANKISKVIADSKNSTKVLNKDKSRGDCNLYCYYLLQDSYGNWYYYYYCCG